MSTQPDPADFLPAHLGPDSDDATMAAWCDAATAGALPDPTLARWQVLRSGVVNLWEYDVAEYWFADGRAQFVGQNQSGKSTLMALTTLIMLAGDLDRQLIDTFGQLHKSFRYYVEPTSEHTDRRDHGDSTSRGWAWVEYGRQVHGRSEFFTALLFAQTRRGANDFTKTWATCVGEARVRAGLDLHRNAATAAPADLRDVPGYLTAGSGGEYQNRLATELFGFEDADRLKAVVRMLKVLRTPHLGMKLDPDFFTDQMREALPSIARSEIDGLADGWDELDRLAADRDSAEAARDAVGAYLRKAWNPWADAVLRRHADDLISAVTRFDNVTRGAREAEEVLRRANADQEGLAGDLYTLEKSLNRDNRAYETLLASRAYVDAQGATDHVKSLKESAVGHARLAGIAESIAGTAWNRSEAALSELKIADTAVTDAESVLEARVGPVQGAAKTAGLPEAAAAWVTNGDGDRLSAAITARRGHVTSARTLLSAVTRASSIEERAIETTRRAKKELTKRGTHAEKATAELNGSLQRVSDGLEIWAQDLGQAAPHVSLRQHWVEQVTAHSNSAAPIATLHALVRATWLGPAAKPLIEAATLAEATAREKQSRVADLDRQAKELRAQGDPVPAPPNGWTRRTRPAPDPATGAPLWRLLDPVGSLLDGDGKPHVEALGTLEAALAATGLLDAWVTPDGVYLAGRDASEIVLTPVSASPNVPTGQAGGEGVAGGPQTLTAVLVPAEDAGACTKTVEAFLSSVTWQPAGPGPQASVRGKYTVAHDGRWTTPLTGGRAAPAAVGAELLGTAAREAARARSLAHLAEESAAAAAAAAKATKHAGNLHEQIEALEQRANGAPHDHDVVRSALALSASQGELEAADAAHDAATVALQVAQQASAAASTDLLTFTGTHRLGRDEEALGKVSTALDKAVTTTNQLLAALASLETASSRRADSQRRLVGVEEEHRLAKIAAEELRATADHAKEDAKTAEEALGQGEMSLLSSATELKKNNILAANAVETLRAQVLDHAGVVAKAMERQAGAAAKRTEAEEQRDGALAAWWIPADAGLCAARGLPDAAGRLLTHALGQARPAREKLHPDRWPDADAPEEKNARVQAASTKLTGPAMIELRVVLESSGGRSVTVLDAPEDGSGLPAVAVLVDSGGTMSTPTQAVGQLDMQAKALAVLHDEKMQEVLVELLASTFVEHLRDRLKAVMKLLNRVNAVLGAHATGASKTTLRLARHPAAGQQAGYDVLTALESDLVDGASVQAQVLRFLEQQIREAQELGRAGGGEWKEHLAALLDYRCWFDVRTDYRVGQANWAPLTKEVHGKNSGGGKVTTLLQPLLATLVATYGESAAAAPRPLWLDEAFTGVDDANRATMLALLVEFDMDFLLAGPTILVSAAQVPSAAVWFFTRAPNPMPGVDLSLTLWAGNTLTDVNLPAVDLSGPVHGARPGVEGPDLFAPDGDSSDIHAAYSGDLSGALPNEDR